MPGMCSVPGCKGYKKARSRGVVFHSLPTRDPERCRKWLKAIQNPKFDEDTPVGKYGNIRVCSQHFKADDYEPDIQAELMKTTPRKILKPNVVPSVFCGRQREDAGAPPPAGDGTRAEGPSTSSQPTYVGVQGTGVDTASPSPSLLISVSSGAPCPSSRSSPPAEPSESLCSLASVDHLSESVHQEPELSWTTASKSDKNTEKDSSQSKTIVNDSCLMELFKKCQTCGQTITKKTVSHCGAQKKAYLNSETKQMIRNEQEGICAKGVHHQQGLTPLHISDPLKKIKAKLRGREKGARSSWSSYDKRSSLSMTSTGASMQEPTALSSLRHVSTSESFEEVEVSIDEDECNGVKNRISDLDSDMENVTETAELRAAGADDSCDEEVYVPLIPQRSTTSELLLECEEEELEPWQKQTSQVHCKDEDLFGELTNDQIDCKEEPSPVQRDAVNISPPELKTETPEPIVLNNQGFIVASPQITSETESVISLGTPCLPRNTFTIEPASRQQLFQEVVRTTETPGANGGVHSSEVQQFSNNPVSLSSVQDPAVYATSSNQLSSDQSNSQALSVSVSQPCFTILEFKSTDT